MTKNNFIFFLRFVKLFIFALSSIFSLLLVSCPMLQPKDTIKDLSGRVGVVDNYSLISMMNPPCKYIYVFGDIWCHQRSDRSIFINENQMPVCARCLGTFIGVPFGILASMLIKIYIDEKLYKRILLILSAGYAPILIDSTGQSVKLWESTNAFRLATGAAAGAAFGLILSIFISVIEKYVLCCRQDTQL